MPNAWHDYGAPDIEQLPRFRPRDLEGSSRAGEDALARVDQDRFHAGSTDIESEIHGPSSREVVAQKDVDADAFLVRHDRFGPAMREQDARSRSRLVAGILIDDGIDADLM